MPLVIAALLLLLPPTLHTSSAAKTIDRIVDVFPAAEKEMVRAMLSESIRAVISQTLLKTKDGSCRVAAHEIMMGTPARQTLSLRATRRPLCRPPPPSWRPNTVTTSSTTPRWSR